MMKKKHFLFVFITFTQSLFSLIGSETVSSPVAFDEFSSQNLEPRRLIVLIESGTSENIAESLYLGTPFRDTVLDNFLDALQTEQKVPILVSEKIVKNFALYHKLCDDFLHKKYLELYAKYGRLEQFKDKAKFNIVIESLQFLHKNYTQLSSLVTSYNKDKTKESKRTALAFIEKIKKEIDLLDDTRYEIYTATQSIFDSYNAYNPKEWMVGKTKEGDYLFLPKDTTGKIAECGLHYEEIEGLNGAITINPLDTANLDSTTTYSRQTAHPERILKTFKKLTKPKNNNAFRPLDVYVMGHGNMPKKSIDHIKNLEDEITFYSKEIQEPHNNTYRKALEGRIIFLKEHLKTAYNIQSQDFSVIAGLLDKDFKNDLVPMLEQAGTRTFTYETCYAGDINALKAWQDQSSDEMGVHSFTIINGALSLTPVSLLRKNFAYTAEPIVKNKKFTTPLNLLPKRTTRDFGTYFKKLSVNIGSAIEHFFYKENGVEEIRDILTVPLVKLATTDYWMPATQLSTDIMQISTTTARTSATNKKPILYNKKDKGAILLATTTLLTPLKIETPQYKLPHLIPLSIGPKLHFIDTLILPNSVSIKDFFKESLQPFYEKLVEVPHEIQKTIVIDNILVDKKIYQAVIFEGYALYIEKTALPNTYENDPKTVDIPLQIVSLDESPIPTNLNRSKRFFQKKVTEAQQQASEEQARLDRKTAAWQTSLNTIKRKQTLLNILDVITKKKRQQKGEIELDWATLSKETEEKIIAHIIGEIQKDLFEEQLLLELSDDELSILEAISNDYSLIKTSNKK